MILIQNGRRFITHSPTISTQKDEKQLKTVYFHYFQTWTSKNQLEACANSNVAGGNTFSGKEKGRRKKLDEFFLFDNFMIDE